VQSLEIVWPSRLCANHRDIGSSQEIVVSKIVRVCAPGYVHVGIVIPQVHFGNVLGGSFNLRGLVFVDLWIGCPIICFDPVDDLLLRGFAVSGYFTFKISTAFLRIYGSSGSIKPRDIRKSTPFSGNSNA
jgi:hypothetical protein